jgi:hypothetical protein
MADDDDYRFDAAFMEIVDAALDNSLVAERKERLERAHAS